jgi:hypothetical protein
MKAKSWLILAAKPVNTYSKAGEKQNESNVKDSIIHQQNGLYRLNSR